MRPSPKNSRSPGALDVARQNLRRSKNRLRRNALAVTLFKRSGKTIEWGCKFSDRNGETSAALQLLQFTDTVNGAAWVFGYARKRERLASALKFKVVRFGSEFRLLAFAPEQRVLDEASKALSGHRSKPETRTRISP